MKKVLVTGRLDESAAYPEIRDALDVRWAPLLADVGVLPVLVPVYGDPAPYFELSELAGLLLTGGNDLSSVNASSRSLLRDEREVDLLLRSRELGLPVLGICRGLQLLAWQDGFRLLPVEGHVASRHRVHVPSGSRFLGAYDGAEVNSYHGFGLEGRGRSLRVAATAPDGTIEALEDPEGRVVGIMWHPERNDPPEEVDLSLLRAVFRTSGSSGRRA